MSSTRKNNRWHFGAKGHIGVQTQGQPIIHSTEITKAKVHDGQMLEGFQHGNEQALFGDSAYAKQADKRQTRQAASIMGSRTAGTAIIPCPRLKRNAIAGIRTKVENPFRVIKHLWGHRKLRYKSLAKNAAQLARLCPLSNVFFCRRELLAAG